MVLHVTKCMGTMKLQSIFAESVSRLGTETAFEALARTKALEMKLSLT